MSNEDPNAVFGQLERTIHEPARLAILSELAEHAHGKSFTDLKDGCALTDGNLNRHLKTLETAGLVLIEKRASGRRGGTRIHLTEQGRAAFLAYLQALETVLLRASTSLGVVTVPRSTPVFSSATGLSPAS